MGFLPRFLLFIGLGMSLSSLEAQIMEIPLPGNPVLERHRDRRDFPAGTVPGALQEQTRSQALCVAAGTSVLLCTDTTGLGADATFGVGDCGQPLYGTLELEGACLRYTALPGLLGGEEQVCLRVCPDGGECETRTFDVRVHRPSIRQTEPIQLLDASGELLSCVMPDPDLDEPIFNLVGPTRRLTGRVITLAECFRYLASRSGGLDTVVYRATYDVCLSDTFLFPIRVITDTISLPFFDDFSYPGPYPDPAKWVDDLAFVNDRMGFRPPSVGVATMDGIDERGRPYPETGTARDFLTSAYLDLSPYPESETVLLTYYLQPRGLGFRPEIGDSLILEFKTAEGQWVTARAFPGYNPFLPGDSIIPFTFYANGIGKEYRYKGFQFRFRNRSNLTGALDHWHIDYVRVGTGLSAQGNNQDIAFTTIPDYLLKRYSAMPWTHLRPDPGAWLNDKLSIGLFNHFPAVATANPSEVIIRDRQSGQTLLENITLLELPPVVPVNQRDLLPGRHEFINTLNAPGLAASVAALPEGPPGVALEMTYLIEQDQEINLGEPVALRNNTVRQTTVLDNYYAYDDGTAESAVVATKSGTQVALQFRTTVADTLRAVQFHFPRYNVDVTFQFFNLRVWTNNLTGTPVYQDFFLRPFYPDLVFEDSMQAFTTYVLFNDDGEPVGVPIPAGDFFIGWQQGSNVDDPIPVGFDKNNPAGADWAWGNTTGSWFKFPGSLRGALMIRPVFGPDTPTHTPDLADLDLVHPLHQQLQVYPNPARDFVRLNAGIPAEPGWSLEVGDALGKSLFRVPWSEELSLGRLPEAWYTLLVRDRQGEVLAVRKLVIAR